ncbi:MAG TPA: hypothetical protein VMW80_00625 [Candidatus Dormibacteraeota bacterium]|nr:hypothetical protein [Candidatus Dormibacteraeota bacterium]
MFGPLDSGPRRRLVRGLAGPDRLREGAKNRPGSAAKAPRAKVLADLHLPQQLRAPAPQGGPGLPPSLPWKASIIDQLAITWDASDS